MAFAADFLWGASTSAYQFEGASDEDGKQPTIQDVKRAGSGDIAVAMDHYHRAAKDLALLAELGLKAYRFSISWARIMHNEHGDVNEKGLAFYRTLIDLCRQYQIEPVVTMYHDDLPLFIERMGGWRSRDTVACFIRYAEVLFTHFGDSVKYWQPICEQNILTIEGITAGAESLRAVYQQNHHMFLAQAGTVIAYKKRGLQGHIGPAPNIVAVYPATSDPRDVQAACNMDMLRNLMYLDVSLLGEYPPLALALLRQLDAEPDFREDDREILKAGVCDYISFSNYTSVTVKVNDDDSIIDRTNMKYGFNLPGLFKITKNRHLGTTEFDYEVDPLGTETILVDIYQRYKIPIFLIQRGLGMGEMPDPDGRIRDERRIRYLKLHIEQVKRAAAKGVRLLGYCTWSAFDLISTGNGVDKRYGLIYINRTNDELLDLRRIPKDSFYWYQKVIQSNGEQL